MRATLLAAILIAPIAAQPGGLEQFRSIAELGPAGESAVGGHTALVQAIRDARNDLCVAIVASHPDDQYVLPATYLRFRHGYRVAVIMMTRGEGGQNSTGPEVGDALGRLRTLETEACARELGFEAWHLNRPDFGYSRSGAETLRRWGRDTTVRDLAKILRKIRPDVVMTTHHAGETHGHDLALLDVLKDAVMLAGDSAFAIDEAPVGIHGLYRGAGDDRDYLEFPVDDVDDLRGQSFRSLAYEALTKHHASGAPFRPMDDFFSGSERFMPVALPGRTPQKQIHVGIPSLHALLLGRVSDAARDDLVRQLDLGLREDATDRPRLVARALDLRRRLDAIDATPGSELADRLARRRRGLTRVAIHGLGLRATADLGRPVGVPGQSLPFRVRVSCSSAGLTDVRNLRLAPESPAGRVVTTVPAEPTRPQPWLIEGRLDVARSALRRAPLRNDMFRTDRFEMPLVASLAVTVEVDGRDEELLMPIELPTTVRPEIELSIHPPVILVPDGVSEVVFNARVHRNTASEVHGRIKVAAPTGFVAEPASHVVALVGEPDRGYLFRLRVPANMKPGSSAVRVSMGSKFSVQVPLRRVAVTVPQDLHVGLVEGVDDTARTVLQQLGCRLTLLSERELPTRRLNDLDTIVVDIRALRHHLAARAEFNRLLAFADNGGRLVVLYHKTADIETSGLGLHPDGLPLIIGKGRATQEDAPIDVLLPDHPLLRTPNVLRRNDWDGWVQERGLYFPASWDDSYDAILAMADDDQPTESGSLLYTRTGRGEFVYCALSLFRQLKGLHPGACRLFANLIVPNDG